LKKVLITGASKGIGAAIARKFAENGYKLLLFYNNSEEEMNDLKKDLSKIAIVECFKADFRNEKNYIDIIKKIQEEEKFIDVLVNNAGVSCVKMLQDCTNDDWNEVFSVNVKAPFVFSKHIASMMIPRKKGCIINISSIHAKGASCESIYSASKAALNGLTLSLSKELSYSGIRVNSVAPGVVETDMLYKALPKETIDTLADEMPFKRFSTTNEIAETVYFLASDKAEYITGQIIYQDGGFII